VPMFSRGISVATAATLAAAPRVNEQTITLLPPYDSDACLTCREM
jgi:hypothetical protein